MVAVRSTNSFSIDWVGVECCGTAKVADGGSRPADRRPGHPLDDEAIRTIGGSRLAAGRGRVVVWPPVVCLCCRHGTRGTGNERWRRFERGSPPAMEAGHQVIGVFMRHGEQSPVSCTGCGTRPAGPGRHRRRIRSCRLDHKQGCCTAADAEDARRVADRLEIPFYAIDLNDEFGRIMDYFTAEYVRGRTPNPCVQCNNWIKFGKLFDYADSVGAEFVATGHYAQLEIAMAKWHWSVASIVEKISRTCCSASSDSTFRECCCRWAATTSQRFANWRQRWA